MYKVRECPLQGVVKEVALLRLRGRVQPETSGRVQSRERRGSSTLSLTSRVDMTKRGVGRRAEERRGQKRGRRERDRREETERVHG